MMDTLEFFICFELSSLFKTLDQEREEVLYFYFVKETTRES